MRSKPASSSSFRYLFASTICSACLYDHTTSNASSHAPHELDRIQSKQWRREEDRKRCIADLEPTQLTGLSGHQSLTFSDTIRLHLHLLFDGRRCSFRREKDAE
jgi:hypothetical protein